MPSTLKKSRKKQPKRTPSSISPEVQLCLALSADEQEEKARQDEQVAQVKATFDMCKK